MSDAKTPGRDPDAVFYAPPHDPMLWTLPWIAAAQSTKVVEDDKPWVPTQIQVRLWFQPADDLPKPQDLSPRAPIPDRPFDLEVHNAGDAPPEGFWRAHPALEAFEVEYARGDGGNWWARLWLKAA